MKIVFLDPVGWDYNIDTPLMQPLGGSQSAVCYLAAELARLGHDVSMVNHIAATGDYRGVRCVHWTEGMSATILNRSDVVIAVNAGNFGLKLRQFGIRVPLVLWSHHRCDQPAVQRLRHPQEAGAWSAFAFVSDWAYEGYLRSFALPRERCRVLHNGIARPFDELEASAPWYARDAPPLLAYTSMPNRGLDVLLDAYPSIQVAFPGVRLRVFSSMSLYRVSPEQDQFKSLYERCRTMSGVEYREPIGQSRLAGELAAAAALAYPCTVPETFCLAAAEAMSLGAALVMTRIGAPAQLFEKYAYFLDLNSDRKAFAQAYAGLMIEALDAARQDPVVAGARRTAQIEFIKANFTWPRIAPQWIAWLEGLLGGPSDRSVKRAFPGTPAQ